MPIKYIYIDVETGGLESDIHPITQVSFILEIDGNIVETFDRVLKVSEGAVLDPTALEITKYSRDSPDLIPSDQAFKEFIAILEKYVDPFDKLDKLYMVTYNGHSFDSNFLRKWFADNNNKWYGSYFWFPSVDCMLLSSAFCIGQRDRLGDFKLSTVAKSMGIEVKKEKLHDSLYDVELTRAIFKKIEPELLS